jgi:hypothetical protein
VRIADTNTLTGMFQRFQFDITEFVTIGGSIDEWNSLAPTDLAWSCACHTLELNARLLWPERRPMKPTWILLGIWLCGGSIPTMATARAQAKTSFPLQVGQNRRHLVDARGTPFLYQADTPWMIFLKLTEAEAKDYIARRREQGFNALQVQLTGFLGMTNRAGELPFDGTPPAQDFTRPNEKFFAQVDRVMREARRQGMLLAIAPLWSGCCGRRRRRWRQTVDITLATVPASTVVAYAVEETVPASFTVESVTESGAFDAGTRKVKWGPFFDATARSLQYRLVAASGFSGTATVSGLRQL